ncbi:MAG: glycoside hydrolase family 172 protein [Chryseolinea sp.]
MMHNLFFNKTHSFILRMFIPFASLIFLAIGCQQSDGVKDSASDNLFVYSDNMEARWSSPENKNGEKGAGGKENFGAKGRAYESIASGASLELLNVNQSGMINRIWITINDRSPEMLRALKIEMFWDNESVPAVSVPFGDFFGVGLGRTTTFQNILFANPEGRSFNCFIPMPFKKAAKIVITNESDKNLNNIFFDVDYNLLKRWNDDYLYFHTYWHRDTATVLTKDFELLPNVNGRGRFLGTNIGVSANPAYKKSWFGEGEVKIYLDGDNDLPTLNGTGTEDYIGTAWGQGKFINNYTGCSIADDSLLQWAFYRFHIPDPIYFKSACKIAIQQIGGDMKDNVALYQHSKAPLIPVTTDTGRIVQQYQKDKVLQLDASTPNGWTNFYRSDDVSSTAYFYLDKPSSNLPILQSSNIRTYNLNNAKK